MEKSIYTREYRVLRDMLRQARERAGITQTELAERIGLTQSFVTKYERGERRLDIVQLRTICDALDMSLSAFIRRYERNLTAKDKD